MLVHKRYNAKWVAKIDDDVYLTPNRLLRVLTQWDSISADYVGCMKTNEVCTCFLVFCVDVRALNRTDRIATHHKGHTILLHEVIQDSTLICIVSH